MRTFSGASVDFNQTSKGYVMDTEKQFHVVGNSVSDVGADFLDQLARSVRRDLLMGRSSDWVIGPYAFLETVVLADCIGAIWRRYNFVRCFVGKGTCGLIFFWDLACSLIETLIFWISSAPGAARR